MIKLLYIYRTSNYLIRNFSNKLIIYKKSQNNGALPDNNNLETLSINDVISYDFKTANTRLITEVLNSCANKFESEIVNHNKNNYNVVGNERFQVLFLSLLMKAHFLKHDHLLPLIRCYEVTKAEIFDLACWDVVGRVLNNCMNIYSDSELIELCFYLVRIKSIHDSGSKEFVIFWERIRMQKDNWLKMTDRFDLIDLSHLLEIIKHIDHGDVLLQERIIEFVKESRELKYCRLEDLTSVRVLMDVMSRNDIFDADVMTRLMTLFVRIDNKSIKQGIVSIADVAGLVWSYAQLAVNNDVNVDGEVVRHLCDLFPNVRARKLHLKLSVALYVLGAVDIAKRVTVSKNDIDQCHVIFDDSIIDCVYTLSLVNDSAAFFDRYTAEGLHKVTLPCTTKAFYAMTTSIYDSDYVRQYLSAVVRLRQKLRSVSLVVRDVDEFAAFVEIEKCVVGFVPCRRFDFVCCAASDGHVTNLSVRHPTVTFHKVRIDEWTHLTADQVLDQITCLLRAQDAYIHASTK